MRVRLRLSVLAGAAALVAGCGSSTAEYASADTNAAASRVYAAPEIVVAPSSFKGVHGLAIDASDRLLAGSVIGNAMYTVDRTTGKTSVFIPPYEGQADDIAVGPKGELAWTSYLQGVLRYRESDSAPIRVLAKDLPGINSLDFNRKTGKLYASQVFLGDALYEIDISGQQAPRLIRKDMGGFNGFEVGQDGWLYGPLWFKGQVAKINPDTGELVVIASGFQVPAAANFDSKGNLYVVDTKAGELVRVDISNGNKAVVARLKTSLDNLAIDKQDRIYVSNMADNSIEQVDPATGTSRYITRGDLAAPAGLKISDDGKTLYVADTFAFRTVDTQTGKVTDIRRMQEGDLEYPLGVGASQKSLLLTSYSTGSLQILDRSGMATKAMLHGFSAPSDAVEMHDGTILVSDLALGSIIRLSGTNYSDRATVVDGLIGPVQMITGRNGDVYVTEAAGKLTRISTKDWSKKTVADGLTLPEGLAETANGRFIVAEAALGKLTEINPVDGSKRTIAENLPIGFEPGPGMPPTNIPTGVAVDAGGNIYFTADRNNAIYRIPVR
ncbi:SMP-30/gluconolactonase/LRE family protein [Noviherbaspirillum aerium]|uniref:SMP-30/gluconolactonase/LRE family protein n=1 Tax=Noviherbaspirillum aerium TaxID=2588497 RepID=UPI00124EDC2F|nr:SMP-30/gluconolactonase/LRE family protein [Noviherbaspirillum aerium]